MFIAARVGMASITHWVRGWRADDRPPRWHGRGAAKQAKQPGCSDAEVWASQRGKATFGPEGRQRGRDGWLIGYGGHRGGRKLTLEAKEATPAGQLGALIGLLEVKRPTRECWVTEAKRSWAAGAKGPIGF